MWERINGDLSQQWRWNKNKDQLQAMTWVDFTNHLAWVDTVIGPRADRICRSVQAVRQANEAPMVIPQLPLALHLGINKSGRNAAEDRTCLSLVFTDLVYRLNAHATNLR